MKAAEILFENNPLSVICSLVCNHENQCEGHCVRGIKGTPVHFSEIERYISDSCFERIKIAQEKPNGMKVAVIGAGPAGITIATSIASALTQRKVRKNTAMTGEITLRGKVLPVGGIKEKILAAKRAGITDIVMCQENEKDINEIPEMYLKGVTFHYVENVQDVWKFALTDEMVEHPMDFTIQEEVKSEK